VCVRVDGAERQIIDDSSSACTERHGCRHRGYHIEPRACVLTQFSRRTTNDGSLTLNRCLRSFEVSKLRSFQASKLCALMEGQRRLASQEELAMVDASFSNVQSPDLSAPIKLTTSVFLAFKASRCPYPLLWVREWESKYRARFHSMKEVLVFGFVQRITY
jgi:hypothetical protein